MSGKTTILSDLSWQDITVKACLQADEDLKDAKVKVYNLTRTAIDADLLECGPIALRCDEQYSTGQRAPRPLRTHQTEEGPC
jgi:hypothetical protein